MLDHSIMRKPESPNCEHVTSVTFHKASFSAVGGPQLTTVL